LQVLNDELQDRSFEEEAAIDYNRIILRAVREAGQEEHDDDNLSEDFGDDDKEAEIKDEHKYECFAFAQEDVLCCI